MTEKVSYLQEKTKAAIRKKPYLSGEKLERLILLTVCSFRKPVRCSIVYEIVSRNFSFSRRTFYLKINQLVEKGEIEKLPCLERSDSNVLLRIT